MTSEDVSENAGDLAPSDSIESLCERDPDEITWNDIEFLETSGERLAAWGWVEERKRQELELGEAAAKVVKGYCDRPSEKAEFLAIRQAVIDEWKPRGGLELTLIDTFVSALYLHRFWLHVHVERATTRAVIQKNDLKKRGEWRPPYSYEAEATVQAAEIAERFHRTAMRSLRALRDLRRYAPKVSIQSAGQVNIGEKQVNLGRVEP
ncbi:hypothetical protein ACFLTM_04100 [Candidatus Bipolaricaulota bacterium]